MVAELMKDRILIGHAIQNDLKVRFALYLLCAWRIILSLRLSCFHIRGLKFVTHNFWLTGMAKVALLDRL